MQVSYRSVSLAAIVSIITVTVVTLLGEVSKPVMAFLTYLTWHHWITKNFLSVIVFLIVLALASRSPQPAEKSAAKADAKALLWPAVTTIVCSAVLVGFFVIYFLKG